MVLLGHVPMHAVTRTCSFSKPTHEYFSVSRLTLFLLRFSLPLAISASHCWSCFSFIYRSPADLTVLGSLSFILLLSHSCCACSYALIRTSRPWPVDYMLSSRPKIPNGTDFKSVCGFSKFQYAIDFARGLWCFVILPCERRARTTVFYFQNVWISIIVPSFIYTKKTIELCLPLSPQIRTAKMWRQCESTSQQTQRSLQEQTSSG